MDAREKETITLIPYYEALNRLVAGESTIIPPGSKITLNAVALEAGKSAGSIKKSRLIYQPLIREIHIRAKQREERSTPGSLKVREATLKAGKARSLAEMFEEKYKAALGRELMLLRAWEKAALRLRKIDNVVPINPLERS